MTVLELIKILKTYNDNTQVLICKEKIYNQLSNLSTKELYPDLTNIDSSSNTDGESESYLVIT